MIAQYMIVRRILVDSLLMPKESAVTNRDLRLAHPIGLLDLIPKNLRMPILTEADLSDVSETVSQLHRRFLHFSIITSAAR